MNLRPLAVVALSAAAALVVAVPASATNAGQYCKKSDAGTVATADNGDKVRCDLDPTDDRYHWVRLSADDDASVSAPDASPSPSPLAREDLAQTGGDAATPYVAGAGALMLAGGGYLALRRRRAN